VSARERLYSALMVGGSHSPDRSERASRLIDAYAHELAERIREHCRITTGPCGCPGADLIDPEVLNGG
jgi:hypothetical protein